MKRPDVIVLDGAQRTALTCVRSLGRRGLSVLVADCVKSPLAAASRFSSGFLGYPDPAAQQDSFLKWLHDLGNEWPGVVVLPVTDVTVPLCIKARDAGAALRTALPESQGYESVIDKFWLSANAAKWGLRSPETFAVRKGEEQAALARDLAYPLVVKPRHSATIVDGEIVRRSVGYAFDRLGLEQRFSEVLQGDDDEALVQQFVKGDGFGIFVIFDQGRHLGTFAHRRLREKPPTGGVSVLSQSESFDEVLEAKIRQMFEDLSWHGVAMVEFKRDGSGQPWLIEINARLWGSVQLAVDSGVDFPSMLYDLAMGQRLRQHAGYRTGRKLRWLLGDLDSLYLVIKDPKVPVLKKLGRALQFLIPWTPGMKYEHFRWGDPVPALSATVDYIRKSFLK